MNYIYFSGLFFLSLAQFAYKKSYSSYGTQYFPGSLIWYTNIILGVLSGIGFLALIIGGFILKPLWWTVFAYMLGAAFMSGFIYAKIPKLNFVILLMSFPIGVAFGSFWAYSML